jgi:hypothetical protein
VRQFSNKRNDTPASYGPICYELESPQLHDDGSGMAKFDGNLLSSDRGVLLLQTRTTVMVGNDSRCIRLHSLERHQVLIPEPLRHCDWHNTPFGKLQAAPRESIL